MTIQEWIIRRHFADALSDLIAVYTDCLPEISTDLRPDSCDRLTETSETHQHFAARIELRCERSDYAVVLITERPSLQALIGESLVDCDDWLKELANQLAGRFKNKVSATGLQPAVSIPGSLNVRDISNCLRTTDEIVAADWDGKKMFAALHADWTRLADGCPTTVNPEVDQAVAEEGSVCLF